MKLITGHTHKIRVCPVITNISGVYKVMKVVNHMKILRMFKNLIIETIILSMILWVFLVIMQALFLP